MGKLVFLRKQNAEIGESSFPGWGVFGTEPENLAC